MTTGIEEFEVLADTNSPRLPDYFATFVAATVQDVSDIDVAFAIARDRSVPDDREVADDFAVGLDRVRGLVLDAPTSRGAALADARHLIGGLIRGLDMVARLANDGAAGFAFAADLDFEGDDDRASRTAANAARAQALHDSLNRAASLARSLNADSSRDVVLGIAREIVRALVHDSAYARRLEDDNIGYISGIADVLDVLARVAVIVYVLLGAPYNFDKENPIRPELLPQHETVAYVGSLEAAMSGVVNAGQDGLISPDHYDEIRNILQQIQLVRARTTAKTQQLELLIAEMLEILNGSIQDETKFREEFLKLDVDAGTAAAAASEMVQAIKLATEHLGTDDPAESGQAMKEIAATDTQLNKVEEPLLKKLRDAAAVGVASGLAKEVVGVVGRLWGDDFMMIAREFISGLARIYHDIFK